jgi:phosphate transport system substrate-binding protein
MNLFRKSRLVVGIMALGVFVSLVAGCGQKEAANNASTLQGTVTASGSTALLPLLKPAQDEFQKQNQKVTVNISGGGSFTGMNQVAAGAVNIGDSDVFLPPQYKGKNLVDHQVAVAPFVFIVNPDVNVTNLTQQQYVDIFTGKITNWKQVGGKDEKITIIHRAKSSGSRATIEAVVLKGVPFTDNAVIQDSNGSVRSGIGSTPGSIGYVDAAYVDSSVKPLEYNGVKYSPAAVTSGKYPVYAYEHMYTKGEATGAVKAFLDYVMSKKFQETYVPKIGFLPVTDMKK